MLIIKFCLFPIYSTFVNNSAVFERVYWILTSKIYNSLQKHLRALYKWTSIGTTFDVTELGKTTNKLIAVNVLQKSNIANFKIAANKPVFFNLII